VEQLFYTEKDYPLFLFESPGFYRGTDYWVIKRLTPIYERSTGSAELLEELLLPFLRALHGKIYSPPEKKYHFKRITNFAISEPRLIDLLFTDLDASLHEEEVPFSLLRSYFLRSWQTLSPLAFAISIFPALTETAQNQERRRAELINAAIELYDGNQEQAQRWLETPNRALGGRRPIEMTSNESEFEQVMNLIGALEEGVFV